MDSNAIKPKATRQNFFKEEPGSKEKAFKPPITDAKDIIIRSCLCQIGITRNKDKLANWPNNKFEVWFGRTCLASSPNEQAARANAEISLDNIHSARLKESERSLEMITKKESAKNSENAKAGKPAKASKNAPEKAPSKPAAAPKAPKADKAPAKAEKAESKGTRGRGPGARTYLRQLVLENGKMKRTDDEIHAMVCKAFPAYNQDASNVQWMRGDIRRKAEKLGLDEKALAGMKRFDASGKDISGERQGRTPKAKDEKPAKAQPEPKTGKEKTPARKSDADKKPAEKKPAVRKPAKAKA